MNQKTFKISRGDLYDDFGFDEPKEGYEVILVGKYDETTGKERFLMKRPKDKYTEDDVVGGIGGNLDKSVKRFHGWRGTTDNIATYAYGVRKIVSVVKTGDYDYQYKITVGKDLHPDWE